MQSEPSGSPKGTRVAVVTGAAAGLGAAYATRLAELGYDVGICDPAPCDSTLEAIRGAGRRAFGFRGDVSDPGDVQNFARGVGEELGAVSVVVNNAGISPYAPFEELSFEEWRQVMAVNLDGMFLMCQAFLPGMRTRRYGRVVNITTTIPWLTVPDFSAYCASKMGVIGLTRALASEYGEHGITVNAAAPSLVRTGTTEAGPQAQMFDAVAQAQAIKRTQEPEDMVGTIAFLCSDDAGFMTGQTLIADGGLTRL